MCADFRSYGGHQQASKEQLASDPDALSGWHFDFPCE